MGRELASTYSSKIHSYFVNTLPITNQGFPKTFQTFSPNVLFDSHKIGPQVIFQ